MQTYLVYMRHPWRYLRRGHLREFISLQLVIGSKTAILFLNPLLWLLFASYFVFRPEIGHTIQAIYPKPLLYLSVVSLVFGNFFYIYVYLLACVRRRQYRLVKWALFIPIYWMMMSVAACMALFQLFFKPHYWEKTIHGLHLRKNSPPLDIATWTDGGRLADEETMRMVSVGFGGPWQVTEPPGIVSSVISGRCCATRS